MPWSLSLHSEIAADFRDAARWRQIGRLAQEQTRERVPRPAQRRTGRIRARIVGIRAASPTACA